MKSASRRVFLNSCIGPAAAGLGIAAMPWCAGCRQRENGEQGKTAKQIDPDFEPGYLALHRSGELQRRGRKLWGIMDQCRLCPRSCGANRLKDERGFCRANDQLEISACHPHFGEEEPLVGRGGSGTIFFTNCSLRCVFCCNWEISQGGQGRPRSISELADMMLHLQAMGCHNINVVTPTHYSPHIVLALDHAAARGLRLPLVYNTCGWEEVDILKLLDGIVDIYLPDIKYADSGMAARYSSGAGSYPEITQQAILEMHRQVGVAKPAKDGLMYRGLMIRHLIMPNRVAGTKEILNWIAAHLPKETYVNLMSQYTPLYKARQYPEIARRITRDEYQEAVQHAGTLGFTNLDIQGWRRW